MGDYLRPREVDEAVAALAARPLTVLGGGTDFYPARVGRAIADDVLDITAIPELRGIRVDGDWIRIGATTTWSDLANADLPAAFEGLKAAAREVGGVQIQNVGTIAGNLCNASPAADGVPCLLSLGAEVELRSQQAIRRLPIEAFILGNRQTARAPDELLSGVLVPRPSALARGGFLKLGARRYLVISIAMVAGVLTPTADGRVESVRIAVGACSAVARRLPRLEAALVGRPCDATLSRAVEAAHLDGLAPIDDVRGTARYRTDAALTLVRRLVDHLAAAAP